MQLCDFAVLLYPGAEWCSGADEFNWITHGYLGL